jgi:hypothetical protein
VSSFVQKILPICNFISIFNFTLWQAIHNVHAYNTDRILLFFHWQNYFYQCYYPCKFTQSMKTL